MKEAAIMWFFILLLLLVFFNIAVFDSSNYENKKEAQKVIKIYIMIFFWPISAIILTLWFVFIKPSILVINAYKKENDNE